MKHGLKRVTEKLRAMWKLDRGFTIDSGAADHVIPTGWINSVATTESEGSRRGMHYIAASGERIPDTCQQKVDFGTGEGVGTSWVFQAARINKPLVSVAKLNTDGWRVVFDIDGSYIEHKRTGKLISLRRERGVFVVDAFLERNPKTVVEQSVFSRQAK